MEHGIDADTGDRPDLAAEGGWGFADDDNVSHRCAPGVQSGSAAMETFTDEEGEPRRADVDAKIKNPGIPRGIPEGR